MSGSRVRLARAAARWSRREFFGAGVAAGLLSSLGWGRGVAAAPRLVDRRLGEDNIYSRLLGVRPHLSGHGYQTIYGGTRMSPEVHRAMAEAGELFVDMHELFDAAGRRLAEATGAEAGLVTAGSFSALLLAGAGCLTGTDPDRIRAVPHVTWPRRELLSQAAHRVSYDRAYAAAGMTIVEAGTGAELEAAITERTALIHCISSLERRDERRPEALLPEQIIGIGRRAGVPVIVDAAAELPPARNLTRWIEMGADLVVFSGGKGLRGPQSTGMLAGRRDLVEAARLHAFPHTGIGRGMKVGKEEVVGLIVALDRFLARDHEANRATWIQVARYVAGELQGIPGLTAEYVPAERTTLGYDAVELTWDQTVIQLTPEEARQRLREGHPRIIYSGSTFITRNLQNGEEVLVARRLRQFFATEAPRSTRA